jgi:hypothetical protein
VGNGFCTRNPISGRLLMQSRGSFCAGFLLAVFRWFFSPKGISFMGPRLRSRRYMGVAAMPEKKKRAEGWAAFVANRFFPYYWADVKARLAAQVIGILLAIAVLVTQLYFGAISANSFHARLLSILWPYLALIAVFVIYHTARTPWLISNDYLDSINATELMKKELQQELDDRKRIPADMEVRLQLLHRTPAKQGKDRNEAGEMSWDVFLNARVELRNPLSLAVLRYTLQLLRHGKTVSLEVEPDISRWEMNLWTPTRVTAIELAELPRQLKSGEPVEGWLHFIVEQATHKALDECRVRLLADVGNSTSYGEQEADSRIWSLETGKTISRKL